MSAPATLASVVEEQWIDLVVLRNRAMADNQITQEEGLRIVAAIDRLNQPLTTLTVSWSVAASLFRGADGIYGYRFSRSLKQLWSRRRNVTPLGRESLDELPSFAAAD